MGGVFIRKGFHCLDLYDDSTIDEEVSEVFTNDCSVFVADLQWVLLENLVSLHTKSMDE